MDYGGVLTSGSNTSTSGSSSSSNGGGGRARPASWDLLVISVVRLATHLVSIPLEAPLPGASSQTDEHKAASTKVPCVADRGTFVF